MTLSAVIQQTEKPIFVKYKRHGHFRTFLSGLQTHGLNNWAAQCRPALPPPKVIGLFENEFISGSTISRLTYVLQYCFEMKVCPAVLLRDELMSGNTTSRWSYFRQYYFKMILFPAVLLQDAIISGSTTSRLNYVLQVYFEMKFCPAVQLHNEHIRQYYFKINLCPAVL
jgi:hypothetical protein